MNPVAYVLLKTRGGRQRSYRLLKEGYRRKQQALDNAEDLLPSERERRYRELEEIAKAIGEIERHDREDV